MSENTEQNQSQLRGLRLRLTEYTPCDICEGNRLRQKPPETAVTRTYTSLGVALNLCQLDSRRYGVPPPDASLPVDLNLDPITD